jgi:hypothetical protein
MTSSPSKSVGEGIYVRSLVSLRKEFRFEHRKEFFKERYLFKQELKFIEA